ncbi:hypothetical protein [Bradyrhizobium sp. NP1]|uniref:hypothetical protein n=1 Tax=Bradyrhizobium sp. NP1 TaxID=3049772 RepID=UPI0025A63735|nr:hypothetical protein [Bradyrhizobium sp. NP1]WJR81158.1 hypothetical protein QOU61_15795 [Bradyrhizobium sp. NP1]
MTFVSVLAVWIALSAGGIAVVYRVGLYIARWSPAVSIACLVVLSPPVLVGAWMVAHQIVRVEQASCEERDPSVERLSGMSPAEFHARCIATRDNSEWLALRRL